MAQNISASVEFSQIKKRDGRVMPFEVGRITNAVYRAMASCGEGDISIDPQRVSLRVMEVLHKRFPSTHIPEVEEIQDVVEETLILMDFAKTAKHYILYRAEHAKIRATTRFISLRVRELVTASKKYFRNTLAEFVYYRTYARWIDAESRRETWIETVDRYMEFMRENLGPKLTDPEYQEVRDGILQQQAMPSMRLLQFAGPAARGTNVCAYNCSFIAPSSFQDFGEIMYISMCGTGLGFSVESHNVQLLPQIKFQTGKTMPTYVVSDSKEGWADALVYGMKTWCDGLDVTFDLSQLRPAGMRLKTMGGKSSGPDPLRDVLAFTRAKMFKRQGKRLSNLDVHDIVCKIGEIVVAGGVRRSALISLSDLDDYEMRDAKKGQFYLTEPQRSLANNSAVYTMRPAPIEFMDEWLALAKSGSGERGIFNRGGLVKTLPERRLTTLKGYIGNLGVNPCGEIILQSKQFCNLSEVVARPEDTEGSLLHKIRLATILGTYQATLTNFGYLSKEWKEHCEQERLLGVSITGQWDCPALRTPQMLQKLKDHALRVNAEYAKRFGINVSTCVTCTKPSGNLSQTVDCSSGLHPRYAPYYIRRVRISHTDALFKMLKEQGVPYHPEVGQAMGAASTYVLDFPVKAPQGSVFVKDMDAIKQLEYWKMVKKYFTEHNPSVTVYVGEDEWLKVANWLYENWDIIGGLSFLPRNDFVYQLAPYEAISEEKYHEMVKKYEGLDFSKIMVYEQEDETAVAKELACAGGACEIDVVQTKVAAEVRSA